MQAKSMISHALKLFRRCYHVYHFWRVLSQQHHLVIVAPEQRICSIRPTPSRLGRASVNVFKMLHQNCGFIQRELNNFQNFVTLICSFLLISATRKFVLLFLFTNSTYVHKYFLFFYLIKK